MNNGAFGENYPYSNFHDLNMDWIIKIAKDFLDQYTHIQEIITTGETELTEKAAELTALLQEWYDTHSAEIAQQIATQLAAALSTFNSSADAKAQQTIASIPADYTALANSVSELQTVTSILNLPVTWRNGYYIGEAGNYVEYAPFNASEKIVLYDESGLLRKDLLIKVKVNSSTYICFYDKDGNKLYSETTPYSGGEYELILLTSIHSDAYSVAISNLAEYTPVIACSVNKASIGYIYTLLPNKKNLFDPYDTRTRENKYFDANGIITLAGFAISHPIPIKGGISYTYDCPRSEFGVNTQYAICTPMGEIIAYRENQPVVDDKKVVFTETNDCYVLVNISLNVTGRKYFRFCETAVFNANYTPYSGKLKGKKILYNGDSIAEGRLTGFSANGGAYPKMIADITGGTYQNRAVGGGTLAVHGSSHNICTDIANMAADGDLICLEGGINDYWGDVPLGDYTPDRFTSDTPDNTTICGAMEYMFRAAMAKWVGKPIVFVIIHKIAGTAFTTNTAGYTFAEVREKMIGICKKYSIPYMDIWGEGGLNAYIPALNEAYMNGGANVHPDGTHPDANGYRLYYVPRLIKLFESVIAD